MDELDDAPKKTKKEKKKAVKKAAVAVAEEVVDESTQWKGKPSSFFVLAESFVFLEPPAAYYASRSLAVLMNGLTTKPMRERTQKISIGRGIVSSAP